MFRITDTARLSTSRRMGVAAGVCLSMTVLLAGCGGGDRVKPFQPSQIIAFGDETSAFDDTATEPVVTNRLVQFDSSNTAVPYAGRYTINVVADASFECKNQKPTSPVPPAKAGCVATADVLALTDLPSNDSFFVGQSTEWWYRLDSGIPFVDEIETGVFSDATSSSISPIYRTTDHVYYCSTDFGDDYGNWVQRLAHGLGGGGLNMDANGCPQDVGNGRSYATWGAKIDDVGQQVATNLGALHDGVLVTMLAGQNDIMAAYQAVQAGTMTADNAHKLMRDKGAQLAGIINTIVGTGARVVYLTVPNMGWSPEANTPSVTTTLGTVAALPTLATTLTHAFNEGYKGSGESAETGGLVLSMINDGHKIVKVDGYNLIGSLGASMAAPFSYTAACQSDPSKVTMPNGTTLLAAFPNINNAGNESLKAKALLLNCRSNNLIVTTPRDLTTTPPVDEVRAYYGSYLWADGRRLAPIGHASMANLAVSRIRDQL